LLSELLTSQIVHPCSDVYTQQFGILIHTLFAHGIKFADYVDIELIFQTNSFIVLFHTTE